MLKVYFYIQFVVNPTCSIYLDHRQGGIEHQYSLYKNMDAFITKFLECNKTIIPKAKYKYNDKTLFSTLYMTFN
jgi:hypothetical protein